MTKETIYHRSELHSGTCEWCGQESDEIISTEDGEKCIDCIEADEFHQQTMKGI